MNGKATTMEGEGGQTGDRHSAALVALVASIVVCAGSHLLLKHAISGDASFLEKLFTLPVIGGLATYACGTALWIVSLRRLDLSFAFPASALQYVLVFGGAWSLLGETIPPLRLAGVGLIIAGVFILASGKPETGEVAS